MGVDFARGETVTYAAGTSLRGNTVGNEIETFDLHRMFLGDQSAWFALEVIFRTTFMFVYTLCLVRLTGKRGLGDITPFELLLVVALGSAVGDPMFYPDVPLLHAMVVVAVIVLLQRAMALAVDRSKPLERVMESTSTRLVTEGVVDLNAMRAERFALDQLFMLLREEGVEQLGQVKRVYLEPSGRISAWLYQKEDVSSGLPLVPGDDPECPQPTLPGVMTNAGAEFACVACGFVVDVDTGQLLERCAACESESGWIRAVTELGGAAAAGGGGQRRGRKRRPLG